MRSLPTPHRLRLWPWMVLALALHGVLYFVPTIAPGTAARARDVPIRLSLDSRPSTPAGSTAAVSASSVTEPATEAETFAEPEPEDLAETATESPAPEPAATAVSPRASPAIRAPVVTTAAPAEFKRPTQNAEDVFNRPERSAATPGLSARWLPQAELPAPARPDFHVPDNPGLAYAPLPELPGAPSAFSASWLERDGMTSIDVAAAQRPWLGMVLAILNFRTGPPAGTVNPECAARLGEQACADPEWLPIELDIREVSEALSPLRRWQD